MAHPILFICRLRANFFTLAMSTLSPNVTRAVNVLQNAGGRSEKEIDAFLREKGCSDEDIKEAHAIHEGFTHTLSQAQPIHSICLYKPYRSNLMG